MDDPREVARFGQQLVAIQRPLFAYVVQLVGRTADADDVLQEVNRVLWEKCGEFVPGTSLTAWAYKVAYFEVQRYRKTRGRERLRFSEATLELLADDAAGVADDEPVRARALAGCIEKLPAADRDLIARRYFDEQDVAKAERSEQSVYRALARARARGQLLECVRRAVAAEGAR